MAEYVRGKVGGGMAEYVGGKVGGRVSTLEVRLVGG